MNDLDFAVAIFDLDGTLLESMYVWQRVDELFFAAHALPMPENFGREIAGMSYRESALYAIKRYGLTQSWEEIVAEWMSMAAREYEQNVRLKPGAEAYLRHLRAQGKRLAVATAMPEELFRPCLVRNGVDGLFEAMFSTEDTGGRGKLSGRIFRLAAERMGVAPSACVVFEDVCEGVVGAKKAGMRAVLVHDAASTHCRKEALLLADRVIDSFTELL